MDGGAAEMIGLEGFQIPHIGEFLVARVFEDAGERELDGAFANAVAGLGVADFVVVFGNDFGEIFGKVLVDLEIDIGGIVGFLRVGLGANGLGEDVWRAEAGFAFDEVSALSIEPFFGNFTGILIRQRRFGIKDGADVVRIGTGRSALFWRT